MKSNKLISFVLFGTLLVLLLSTAGFAQETSGGEEVNIYFFTAEGCPHCAAEKAFLDKLEQKYDNLDIHVLEVTKSRENAELLAKAGKELNADVSGVPFTIVGEQHFIGWYNEETTGKAIEDAINCVVNNHCIDVVSGLMASNSSENSSENRKTIPEKLHLPIIGEVETKNLSLPLLTLLLAGLDGFNPCAMWVLLFLISLLFGMQNKKRMWIFGSVFIAASAFVYFLFMAAWLNLFLFLGFIFWVRVLIGGVALWAAYYNLKEYFTNPSGGCKVTGEKKRRVVFDNLKKIIQERHVVIALLGLIVLAFAVNLVELICSAGLPAVYTQILALNNLPAWQYYSYLILYIFIFMLDDLIVFFIAMATLQVTGISSKYSRLSHLIGGIVMLIIGTLMIFRPEWLMFG
jgi:thiol-disulfide isomerase/thioredoxin